VKLRKRKLAGPKPGARGGLCNCPQCAAANRECAALILADVARYGGEGSLIAQWARRVRGK